MSNEQERDSDYPGWREAAPGLLKGIGVAAFVAGVGVMVMALYVTSQILQDGGEGSGFALAVVWAVALTVGGLLLLVGGALVGLPSILGGSGGDESETTPQQRGDERTRSGPDPSNARGERQREVRRARKAAVYGFAAGAVLFLGAYLGGPVLNLAARFLLMAVGILVMGVSGLVRGVAWLAE